MHMQRHGRACCAVQDPSCKMLRAYLHNDYDDDDDGGRVDNDDDDDDDADDVFISRLYLRAILSDDLP